MLLLFTVGDTVNVAPEDVTEDTATGFDHDAPFEDVAVAELIVAN